MAECFGQILPTVPANIIRISLSNYSSIGEFKLKNQEFDMRGIGRSYFDDETKNDLGFFNGAYDLYHICLLYTSPSPRDQRGSRMPSSA